VKNPVAPQLSDTQRLDIISDPSVRIEHDGQWWTVYGLGLQASSESLREAIDQASDVARKVLPHRSGGGGQ
jgi:hypothetical protein